MGKCNCFSMNCGCGLGFAPSNNRRASRANEYFGKHMSGRGYRSGNFGDDFSSESDDTSDVSVGQDSGEDYTDPNVYADNVDTTAMTDSNDSSSMDTSETQDSTDSADSDSEDNDAALADEETATVASGGPSYASVSSSAASAASSGGSSSAIASLLAKALPAGQAAATAYLDKMIRSGVGGAAVTQAASSLLAQRRAPAKASMSPLLFGGLALGAVLLLSRKS